MPKSVADPVMCVERIAPPDRSVMTVVCIPMMKHSKNNAKDGMIKSALPKSHCKAVMPNRPNTSR